MQLIDSVRVEGFRSVQAAEVTSLTAFTALVGKNSSGKSNFLRAMNLFFNDEVEPGRPLVFARDVYDEVPRLKKKKRIIVSIDFVVPEIFNFRRELEGLNALGDTFNVTRTWEIDPRRLLVPTTTVTVDSQPVANGTDLARQFLSLLTFRYIPNRSVPARLLRDESQAIANAIFRRMRGGDQGADLLKALSEAAGRLLQGATANLESTGSPISSPTVATTDSIGQMLQMSGFQGVGQHGGIVRDEDWGSGHQAFFLYELLRAVDTDVSQSFGWRQAAIWGVEEPESALHRDLETRLAEQMRLWTGTDGSRLQVIETTHSPVFTMAAESGFWVELDGKRTAVKRMSIPELTRAAEIRGVTGWIHPILSFPWNPVVLVEGEIDARALTHVSELAGLNSLRFLSLPTLDSSERRGGADQLIRYTRGHRALIPNRPRSAPLIVLFDWDVHDTKLAQAREAYGSDSDRFVFRMNPDFCEPEMGRSFTGVERFYPPRLVLESHQAGEMIVGMRKGHPYSVAADEFEKGKLRLLGRLLASDDLDELRSLLQVVIEVDARVRGPLAPQLTLPGV